jgi:hypothetical protein
MPTITAAFEGNRRGAFCIRTTREDGGRRLRIRLGSDDGKGNAPADIALGRPAAQTRPQQVIKRDWPGATAQQHHQHGRPLDVGGPSLGINNNLDYCHHADERERGDARRQTQPSSTAAVTARASAGLAASSGRQQRQFVFVGETARWRSPSCRWRSLSPPCCALGGRDIRRPRHRGNRGGALPLFDDHDATAVILAWMLVRSLDLPALQACPAAACWGGWRPGCAGLAFLSASAVASPAKAPCIVLGGREFTSRS